MFVLETQSLHFSYQGAAPAESIRIPDLSLKTGQRVLLSGSSGVGKSTFLNLIAGVLEGHQGTLRVLGHDWSAVSAAGKDHLRAEHLGYIFQSFNLLGYLSVLENILLPGQLNPVRRKGLSAAQAKARALTLLNRVGLGPKAQASAADLSLGQQQRVAALRALIDGPQLLLADEPTSSLDPQNKQAFMELLLELCGEHGSSLLMVSHDPALARHFDLRVELSSETEEKL